PTPGRALPIRLLHRHSIGSLAGATVKEKFMSYAIVGFGNIGRALAKAFARNGIEVSVATTRDPESFASDAAAIGPTIIPKTLTEAVKADIVFLAVRFEAHPDVAKALP